MLDSVSGRSVRRATTAHVAPPVAGPAAASSGEPGWFGFLDGVRGLSALWVIAGHCLARLGLDFPLVGRPAVAVDVFMMMSGFLMAHNYRARLTTEPWERPATWGRFYARRFFRIAPLYYVALAIALSFAPAFEAWDRAVTHLYAPPWAGQPVHDPTVSSVWWGAIVLRLTFLFGLLPAYASSTVLPDWSIGLEMQFYAMFPFLMLAIRRVGYIWVTAACLAATLVAHRLFGVYVTAQPGPLGIFPQPSFLPLKLPLFLVGIFLAEAAHLRARRPDLSSVLFGGAVALAAVRQHEMVTAVTLFIGAALLYDPGGHAEDGTRRPPAVLLGGRRLLSSRAARFLGDTSYGAYLIHIPVMLPVAAALAARPWFRSLPAVGRYAVLLGVVALVTYALAELAYRAIEKPGIALGRRLLGRSAGARAAGADRATKAA